MPLPALALLGGGVALKGLTGLLGGGKSPQLPKEVLDLLKANARNNRSSSFVPDATAFNRQADLNVQQILEQFGVNTENFNAQTGASGTFTSGEKVKTQFRDITAPAVRAATQAKIQGQVSIEQLRLQGLIAGDSANQNALSLFAKSSTPQVSGFTRFLNTIGGAADQVAGQGFKEVFGQRDDASLLKQIEQLKEAGLL